jgi:hypothetical protein
MDRMSVSLRVVSSNPGVSIRVTRRPLTTNGREVRTSLVQLSRPRPTGRLDPLALLINYVCPPKIINVIVQGKGTVHTVDLPLPVAPMTLEEVSMRLPENMERFVRNPDFPV